MIEKIMELLERFVVAAEKNAESAVLFVECYAARTTVMEHPLPICEDCKRTGEEEEHLVKLDPVSGDPVHYDPADLDGLKKLCAERGIEVPPRTRATTMISKLETWDLQNPVLPVVEQAGDETTAFDGTEHTPSAVTEVAGSPFPVEEDETPQITRADCLIALQDLSAADGHDNTRVHAVLNTVAGVTKLADVPVEKFAELLAATNKELGR